MKRVVLAVAILTSWITGAAAVECYEGKASVNQAAPKEACTATEKGYSNTGKGPLTHEGCTAAKHQAANKLRPRLSTTCRKYVVESGCKKIDVGSCA
jgi:hypothetical protein